MTFHLDWSNPAFQEPKPLVWEAIRFTERFQFVNQSKIVSIDAYDEKHENWSNNEW